MILHRNTIKKGFISISVIFILMLATPFIGTGIIAIQTADQIYSNIEDIPQKEIGLVLGAAAFGDRLSDILRDRVDTAIELYKAEKISILVMSGALNESQAMKKYAIAQGVPTNDIIEDITGLNTLASVKNIAELNRSTIIFTQRYHLPRALFMANSMGIDAIGMESDKQQYLKMADFKKREILATSKAILDIYF